MTTAKKKTVKFTTPVFRGSYANLFVPNGYKDSEPKYSVDAVLPKDHEFWKTLRAKLQDLSKELGIKKDIEKCIKDGDDKEDSTYKGCYYITPKNKTKPMIIDKDQNEILDKDEVYSGAYYKAVISIYTSGDYGGLHLSLLAIQKVKDGERLSGASIDLDNDLPPIEDEDFLGD